MITAKTLQRKKTRINDISVSYLLKDAALPKHTVIFIHGFPFNKNMWTEQLNALGSDVKGIAYDVRGHGITTSGRGYFTIDLFANDLIELIQQQGGEPVIVCGISMGGYIALRAHELRPEVFKGLILSDTHARSDDNEGKIKRFNTLESVLKYGRRAFAIGFSAKVFSSASLEHEIDAIELIRSSIRRNDVRSICATLLALASRTDTTGTLKNIKVPALVIRGVEDQITAREQAEQLQREIPEAEFVELEACGHLPNLEDPVAFNKLIESFLAGI